MTWNELLAPIFVALAEALIKAILKWIDTWDDSEAAFGAIDKVADAVLLFYDSKGTRKDYLNLRAKLGDIKASPDVTTMTSDMTMTTMA